MTVLAFVDHRIPLPLSLLLSHRVVLGLSSLLLLHVVPLDYSLLSVCDSTHGIFSGLGGKTIPLFEGDPHIPVKTQSRPTAAFFRHRKSLAR